MSFKMFKFFIFLFTVCVFHGAKADFTNSEVDEADYNVSSSSSCSGYVYLYDANESENQAENNFESSQDLITEGDYCDNEEDIEEYASEYEDDVSSSSSSDIIYLDTYDTYDYEKDGENNTETDDLTATEDCTKDLHENTGNDAETLKCTLPNESATCVRSCPPMKTCDNRDKIYNCPFIPVNASCTYRCTCNDGYYRNCDGFCVTSELCDKKCTRPNEVYTANKKRCPLEICPSLNIAALYDCNPKEVGQPGCVCKPGFFRSSFNSTCIPKEQCPGPNKPLQCTLPNESLKCVKSCPRPRTCATRNIHYKCANNLNETCKNECVCDDGFFRNSDGFCVTYDLCDKKCPGPNEEYKSDKKTCPPEICKSIISRYACDPKEVGQPGCVCKPGFLRLTLNSTCIPTKECPELANQPPECTRPHESLKCMTSCPRPWTCANRNYRYKCARNLNETCKNECVCDDDFYRNSEGFCVTYDLCDKKCPGPNEEYKADKKTCPPETCSSIVSRYACDPKEVGQPGCVCKPGFLRPTLNSTCIPTKECPELANQPPECTLPNESVKCVKSCPRPRTCATRNIHYRCPDTTNEPCKYECACDDGFYRNSDGFCVTYDLCDKKCTGANEEYKADKKTCPLEVCPSTLSVIHYVCNPHEVGQPGCACKPGYLRLNANSTCIPKDQCPGQNNATLKCPLPNESATCVKSCPPLKTCENRDKLYNCPLMPVNASCTYKCECNDGYYRNSDGFCVTSELCDKKCTGPYEIYKADKKKCPLETCPPKFPIRLLYACNPREVGYPGCVCKPGFFRSGPNSTCIPKDQCPGQNKPLQCTLPNESVKCLKSCPGQRTCDTRDALYKCANNLNETCKNECVCNDGFYRNSDGFCVTYDLCDKKCTGPNEVYKSDKKTCPPEICKSIISRYACDPKEVGQPGCVCKPGFLRLTLNSTCIPTNECPELANQPPECTLPNESLTCVKSCPPPRTCANRDIRYFCPNTANETCKYDCTCDNGFYRNSEGFCVTYNLCDKKCTGPNEEYKADKKTCPLEVCPSTISVIRFACNPHEMGQPGCACKPGFLRLNANSTCIPKEQCPGQGNTTLKCSLPNERATCVQTCPPLRTCENRGKIYHCPDIAQNTSCTYKCACNDGYYRNSDGFCVTSELCDKKCTRPNEVYKADKKTCPRETCPSKFLSRYACNPREVGYPGCVCKPGFFRNGPNLTCIPKDQCPGQNKPLQCTLPNESLKCVKSCPRPRTCATRNLHYKCLNNLNETCKNECVCDDGFYRNSDGFCVTYDLCDKKCPGPNEEYKTDKKKCPPEICSSIVSKYACDPKEVGQPGCVCKPGFLRLTLNSTCIPTKECPELANQPPECTLPNESVKCVKSCPRPRTCATRNIRYKCPDTTNETCKYECACDDGFYRNSDGFCVTYDLCDKKCTGANEEYKADKKTCPLEVCPSTLSVIRYACNPHEVGQPGCACKPGYLRLNANSTCIPKEQCPGQNSTTLKCSLPNESAKCVISCPPLRTCENRGQVYPCPYMPPNSCTYKCACNDGYYRNSDGFCVTSDLCDKKCTGPNEIYKADKKTCPFEICPSSKFVILIACNPNEVGQPGCVCKPGYFRSGPNSTCIPKDQCPGQDKPIQCTLPNESLKCLKSCPGARTCASRNALYKCANNVNETCKNQCVCDDGFYRNTDGFCVTYDLCDKKCPGPHEEYKADKKKCPPEICKSIVSRYACDPKEVGQPGCVCKPGYLRLTLNSTCIPTTECPEMANQPPVCTLPNESAKCVKSCPPPRTCANRNILFNCLNIANETCKYKCVCDDGFYRNSDGFCVTDNLCASLKCSLPNESAQCLQSCPPMKTCENRGKIYHCPRIGLNASCTYNCTCNDGYYRNSDGFCVTSDLCDKKCPRPNEVYKADKKTCPLEMCPSSKFVIHYACNPNEVGQPGCVCKPGFLRSGPNSTCIPKEQCPSQDKPPQCNQPNESLQCLKSCPEPWTCETRDLRYKCFDNKNETCKIKCVCNEGFYRNSDGYCVTYDLCDKKCSEPNEEYKADKKTCPLELCPSKLAVIDYVCNPNEVRQPGCVCKPGFRRPDFNSPCIPIDQCPGQSKEPLQCSLPNESPTCVKSCPPLRTCENRGKIYSCPAMKVNATCTSYQCACNDGFYRNCDGFCVTSELCDKKCTRPNEVYKADKKTCPLELCPSKFARDYACNPNEVGQPGCVCKPGFLRISSNSTCIPKEQCPNANKPLECTLPNESLKCVKSCPLPKTCLNRNIYYKCFDTKNETCQNKCVCNDGFFRNSDGFCVTRDLCDKKCTGPNEVYKADKKNCPPQTCASILALYKCDSKEKGQPGCVCKPGYLRLQANSTCIPTSKCPQNSKNPNHCH